MPDALSLEEAADLTRTGDVWLFRGRSAADRAIRTFTNSPVNHVGMAIVIDDLPPLLWHAELSQAVQDVWSGRHHRGVQLHDLHAAVTRWCSGYGESAWFRQLTPDVGRAEEDAALHTVARLDGVSFPSVARLAGSWLIGRDAYVPHRRRGESKVRPEAAFCAETVAATLREMGVVTDDRKANWYDPGTFWSGAYLPLREPWSYGPELEVAAPPPEPGKPARGRRREAQSRSGAGVRAWLPWKRNHAR